MKKKRKTVNASFSESAPAVSGYSRPAATARESAAFLSSSLREHVPPLRPAVNDTQIYLSVYVIRPTFNSHNVNIVYTRRSAAAERARGPATSGAGAAVAASSGGRGAVVDGRGTAVAARASGSPCSARPRRPPVGPIGAAAGCCPRRRPRRARIPPPIATRHRTRAHAHTHCNDSDRASRNKNNDISLTLRDESDTAARL